jgi:ferredoxin
MSGMTSFDELLKNVEMVKNPGLTNEDKKELKLAAANNEYGLYCLQCRECEGQCRHNLDIPTLMRSYMYAYGYRNMHHAQQTVEMVDLSGNTCDQCDACTVNCKAGFNLKTKISDIARLKDVPSDFLRA